MKARKRGEKITQNPNYFFVTSLFSFAPFLFASLRS